MNATTLNELKDWMSEENLPSSGDLDNQLNQLIPAVSRAMEERNVLNQPLLIQSYTVEIPLSRIRTKVVTLKHSRVQAAPTPIFDHEVYANWAAPTVLVAGTDYTLFRDDGWMRMHIPILGPTILRHQYDAGFATDEADLLTNYPAITQAANMWISEIFRRRTTLTKRLEMMGTGQQIQWSKIGPPPDVVKELLEPFVRRSFIG